MTIPSVQKTGRLLSLDVFRGATIAGMMLVNNPGDWKYIYPPFGHAAWNGWTYTDTIFPFFLWIVGVAMTFSFAKRKEKGDDLGKLGWHVVRRAAIIFLVGLFLSGVPFGLLFGHQFSFSTIRIPGVLQRIAVCYLISGLIVLNTGWKAQVDGEETPILRADYTFRAVPLIPGEHLVRFYYDPWTFKLGLGISLASLGFLAFYALRSKIFNFKF